MRRVLTTQEATLAKAARVAARVAARAARAAEAAEAAEAAWAARAAEAAEAAEAAWAARAAAETAAEAAAEAAARAVAIGFDRFKIYATEHDGYIYKLSTAHDPNYPNTRWIFKALYDSVGGSTGYHATAQKAIEAEYPTPVYEFDSVKEFAQWVLDNVKE